MDLHASQIQGFFDVPVDKCVGNDVFFLCPRSMLTGLLILFAVA